MAAFTDQVAVVTGASSGIGKAIALALGSKGATLCLVGRKPESLKSVAENACSGLSQARCYSTDLSRESEIQELVSNLRQDFARVDLLIHSAGHIALGTIEHSPVKDFDRQYYVNLRAPYVLTQSLLPMLKAARGQIVFINSSAGVRSGAKTAQYGATKHALKAFADSLRQEVNQDGLRITSVFLGRTATPMQEAVHQYERRAYRPELLVQPEDAAGVVISALSVPRTAEVTDISIRPLTPPR